MVTEKEKKSIFIVFLKHLFWPNPPLKEIVNVVFFWFSQIQSNVKSTSLSLIRQITMLAIAWIFFPICCAALANTNWLFYIYSVASMPSPSAYCRLESFAFSFFFLNQYPLEHNFKVLCVVCWCGCWLTAQIVLWWSLNFATLSGPIFYMMWGPDLKVFLWVWSLILVTVWTFLTAERTISVSKRSAGIVLFSNVTVKVHSYSNLCSGYCAALYYSFAHTEPEHVCEEKFSSRCCHES